MLKIKQKAVALLDDPQVMVSFNGWATVFWIVMIPISAALGWLALVLYVSALSLWALVSGHLSAWQSARVEREQRSGTTLNEEDRLWLLENFRCQCHDTDAG